MKTASRYLFAVIAMGVALTLSSGLSELVAPMRMFFVWSAVLVSAVVVGVGPAFLAIAIALIVAIFPFMAVPNTFTVRTDLDFVRLAMFAVFAGGISLAVGFRRRAEERAEALGERLRRGEARYRTLVEASAGPQAVWTATPEGRIEWTPSFLRLTGLSRDETERKGVAAALYPDDASRFSARWAEALRTGTRYEDEVRMRVASGQYRWFALKAVPVVEGMSVREWVGLFVDIDDAKRHADQAAFINSASEVLSSSLGYEKTMRNLARLCVPAIADWCSIDIGDANSYQRLVVESAIPEKMELVHQLDRLRPDPELNPIVEVLRTGAPQLVENVTDEMLQGIVQSQALLDVVRKLGLRSWIIAPMIVRGRTLGALTVVYGDSERHYGASDVSFITDLASRAATAIDNARLYEAADAANRAKDEFLATLSHELRTPLTAISGWAHMLQMGMDPETTRLAVDTILRSAKSQGELIDDLLDLSRIVAGTLQLNVAPVDLAKVVDELMLATRPAVDAKRLQLELHVPEAALVMGDERRLRQVIWNLISNAVKFTEPGGHIIVTLTMSDDSVRFSVADTGRGIDPQFLPHVWDRFRQADSSTSRLHGGLGLGLSVVRHLVELHGGVVGAKSDGEGMGSTFWFELPKVQSVASITGGAPQQDETLLDSVRVLLVDDHDDGRVVVAAMLRAHGADVTAVKKAAEVLDSLDGGRFDIVVSDLAMPDMDGFSLGRQIRERYGIPIVALLARADGDDREKALDAGFSDFVRKPVEPDQLARTIAGSLRRE